MQPPASSPSPAVASFAAYQTVLNSVRYTNAGDNPTNYGTNQSRTLSVTAFDGLTHSDLANGQRSPSSASTTRR